MSKNKKEFKLNSRVIESLKEAKKKMDDYADLFENKAVLQKKSVSDDFSGDEDFAEGYRRSMKGMVGRNVDTITTDHTDSPADTYKSEESVASSVADLFENKANLKKKSVSDDFSGDEDFAEGYRRGMKGMVGRNVDTITTDHTDFPADTYKSEESVASSVADLFENKAVLQKKSVSDVFSDDDEDYAEGYRKSFAARNEGIIQATNTPHENEINMTMPVIHDPNRIVDSVRTDMKGGVNQEPTEKKHVATLSSGVLNNSASVVCDVAPPTSPIIRMEKGSNTPLRIALDFCQKHHLVLCDKMLWIYNGQYYVPLTESDAQRYIFSEYCDDVSRGNTMSLIKNIVSLLRVTVADTVEMFPTNEHIIVFRNGTLEVANDYFRENSPGDLASSALSIDYDPNQKEMPVTNKFLNTITNGDSVLYKRLLQVIGYILSNDLRAKSFFYLEGVGNAGKSRFCDLIASFFSVNGANKVARIALQDLGNKFSMANLVNTKLNISEDLPDKPLSQVTVSRIKMISDANCLEAEAKFIQSFSFKPQCKLLFASNHPLKIKDRDDAFVNRVIYIPFKNPIPKGKQDKHILEKMQLELPALFNYAYSAYKQLVESGYSWAGINIFKPEIVITNLSSTEEREYAMKLFVEIHCEESQDSTVAISEIQSKYNEFCDEYEYVPVVGDRFSREIYKFLPGTPERVKIGNQKRGFKGICLK